MKATIQAKIKSLLDTQVGSGKPLKAVYENHEMIGDGYPYATIEPSTLDSDYLTNRDNFRKYVFRIIIHQQEKTISGTTAIKRLNEVFDILTDMFDQSWSLDGVVDMSKAATGEDGYYEAKTGPVRYSQIVLSCEKQYQSIALG